MSTRLVARHLSAAASSRSLDLPSGSDGNQTNLFRHSGGTDHRRLSAADFCAFATAQSLPGSSGFVVQTSGRHEPMTTGSSSMVALVSSAHAMTQWRASVTVDVSDAASSGA